MAQFESLPCMQVLSPAAVSRNTALLPQQKPRLLATARAVPNTAESLPVAPVQHDAAATQHVQQVQSASVSRVLLNGQSPNIRLRTALSHKLTPITLTAAGVYAGSVVIGTLRDWTISQSRACTVCRGYSIQRCDLCGSAGSVTWEGKWGHVEPCPKCVPPLVCGPDVLETFAGCRCDLYTKLLLSTIAVPI
jgi:hypothetical protein